MYLRYMEEHREGVLAPPWGGVSLPDIFRESKGVYSPPRATTRVPTPHPLHPRPYWFQGAILCKELFYQDCSAIGLSKER
jgi:hypothetical protein